MLTQIELLCLTVIELDDLACEVSRKVSRLEEAYHDYNGDWICKKAKREHAKLSKYSELVDSCLELVSSM
jgi:hypothetical protein